MPWWKCLLALIFLKTAKRLRFDITNHQDLWRPQHGRLKLRSKVIETWQNSWSFRRSKVASWLVPCMEPWWKCSHGQTLLVPLRSDYQTVWKLFTKKNYMQTFFFNMQEFAHLVLWLKGNIWLHALHKLSATQTCANFCIVIYKKKERLRILRTWVHLCSEKTKLMFEKQNKRLLSGLIWQCYSAPRCIIVFFYAHLLILAKMIIKILELNLPSLHRLLNFSNSNQCRIGRGWRKRNNSIYELWMHWYTEVRIVQLQPGISSWKIFPTWRKVAISSVRGHCFGNLRQQWMERSNKRICF